MMNSYVRWKQRFQNFEKSYQILSSILEKKDLSVVDQLALIKIFELSFDLAWNTLKDYLQAQEVVAKFPREVIKESIHYELLEPTDPWLEMLENRNLMAHTYDSSKSIQAVQLIREEYAKTLQNFYQTFQAKLKSE
jgi:nucleotidyltransferase substrate binding protein (TIGR01987 family)